ncbi:MAG: leucine-rich repeat domain-containing protein [Candidatus Hodarchaeota archaeon]
MVLTPQEIFEELKKNRINKFTAYDILTSLVENSRSENIRVESIRSLEKIGLFNDNLFRVLENLLISDSNGKIRKASAEFLKNRFLEKAIRPFKWAIKHETEYECLITIIQSLERINNNESKLILNNEIKRITKTKYLNKAKRIENKKYKKIIKKLLKSNKYYSLTQKELSEILINYLTIVNLTKQYPNVFYELNPQNGLIKELDLSDYLEYEVKGIPFGWKNNIKSISEIVGLKNLRHLNKMDFSNNQIEDIKELVNFENVTHLILTNNKISELQNLEYIKALPNLEYLDLRYNDIVKKINPNEFDKNIRVLLNDFLILK